MSKGPEDSSNKTIRCQKCGYIFGHKTLIQAIEDGCPVNCPKPSCRRVLSSAYIEEQMLKLKEITYGNPHKRDLT